MAHHQSTASLDDALAYRILRTARHLRYGLAHVLDAWETGLSPEQYFLLFRVAEEEGRSQRELGDASLDDRPNITRLVVALEKRGWVERRPCAVDARVKRIHLTPEGRRFFDGLRPRIVAERQRIFGDLNDADVATFLSVLSVVETRALP